MRYFTVCHTPRFSGDRYIDGYATEIACYTDERDAMEHVLDLSVWFPTYTGRYISIEHNS